MAIKENAAKLLFFPEGTRHQGSQLLPFKKGAFHIAIQSESAIQPVVTSRYFFLDSNRKIFGRGNCRMPQKFRAVHHQTYLLLGHSIIEILPEISCKGMTKDDLSELLQRTQAIMQQHYDKLNAELCPPKPVHQKHE